MDVKTAFLKTKKGIICLVCAAVLLAACVIGVFALKDHNKAKFHDLTVELGTESIKLSQFMTEYARDRKVSFVSDPSVVNLNTVGETELVLAHGKSEETVTLTVCDTTAPTAEFVSEITVFADYVPHVSDFVSGVFDYSDTVVTFENEFTVPEDYSDITVSIAVTDAHGNKTTGESVIHFKWMYENVALEYGTELTHEMLLVNPEKDEDLIPQTELDKINASPIGEYVVESTCGGKTLSCAVDVQDTQGPDLVTRDVQLHIGGITKKEAFIVSCEDASGVKEIRLVTEIDFGYRGKQTVTFEAEDFCGNITTKDAVLYISNDHEAPIIRGLLNIDAEKYTEPDYVTGVTAYDYIDGDVEFTYDASSVDTSAAGTYFVVYTAKDASGNVASSKRKVIVPHDQKDTDALVAKIAETLSDDPEEIRLYVKKNISYNISWGGADPVWKGFTTRSGNCYVHALCLQALYRAKGYECEVIWATDEGHYWVIVKVDGVWWHADATPGDYSKYGLMTDQERLSTLRGRTWDRSLWPACGE